MYEATRCTECKAPAVVAITPVGACCAYGLCATCRVRFERTTRLSYYARPVVRAQDNEKQRATPLETA